MSSEDTNDVTQQVATVTTGRVKWFNNRSGYGFITVTSGENMDTDIFVHHSAIMVAEEQYRYLVQGEYVNFKLCSVNETSHKWQAGEVRGMNGGKLMCETHHELRESKNSYNSERTSERKQIRQRGGGPRDNDKISLPSGIGDEWMLIRRRPRSQERETRETARTRQHR